MGGVGEMRAEFFPTLISVHFVITTKIRSHSLTEIREFLQLSGLKEYNNFSIFDSFMTKSEWNVNISYFTDVVHFWNNADEPDQYNRYKEIATFFKLKYPNVVVIDHIEKLKETVKET